MKIFLYDTEIDNEVNDHKAGLEEALDEFYALSDEDGSFFGIEDSNNKILQFSWEDDNKWLIDIPVEPGKYSLQKYANYEECIDLIKNFYQGEKPTEIAGLHQVYIMEFTLDEVLSKM